MSSRRVPFFDYPKAFSSDKNELMSLIDSVCSKGAFIMQSELSLFEENLARFTGSNFALGVANATDGLEMAWTSIGLKRGEEVIISSHTMLATASAIKMHGAIPVPVDIGDDGLIDPDAISNAITQNTRGISPTHLNGRTCDMEKIINLANKHDLVIVEDAAQALGSTFKGKHAGTFGYASAISFYPAKVLGCLGDGGGMLVSDRDAFDNLYMLRDHGRDRNGEAIIWGRNSRLDNLQAAILDYRLQKYDQVIERRRQIASLYHTNLLDVQELILPPEPTNDPDRFDIYQNYEIQATNRDQLKDFLKDNEIGTLIQWGGKAIHHMQNLGFVQDLPKTDAFFKKCLMLPMNMFITDDDVIYICEKVKSFYAQKII